MNKPEVELYEPNEEDKEPSWENTDSTVEDIIWDLSPVEIKGDIGTMVRDIREHILDQFEKYDIATREQINLYVEGEDESLDIDDPTEDINID